MKHILNILSNGWNLMKLILNICIYDHGVDMRVKFHQGVICCNPFIAYILMFVSILSHNLVSNGRNFMKLIQSIYDHCVVLMHMKFCWVILSTRGVIAL